MNKKYKSVILENLTTGYRNRDSEKTVSEGINIAAEQGKLIFLTGQNGAGKTTLLKTITGDLKPLSGKVIVGKEEISSLKRNHLSMLISVVLTSIPDPGYMTVEEIVSLGRAPYTGIKNSLSSKDKTIIRKSIKMLSLYSIRNRLFSRLSDGEKQKTMIARALCQDTEIICMDEPSSHLDFPSRIELVSYLKKISCEENKTVIISSHDLNSAVNSSDIMWLIDKSGKIHSGAPEDLALSGKIGEVFSRGSLKFSKETGEFITERLYSNILKVTGDAVHVFWTEKALRKLGIRAEKNTDDFSGNSEAGSEIKITGKGEKFIWNYKNHEFENIESLLCFIRENI